MSSYKTILTEGEIGENENTAEMNNRLKWLKQQNEELIRLGSTGEEQGVREFNIKIYELMIKTQSKLK